LAHLSSQLPENFDLFENPWDERLSITKIKLIEIFTFQLCDPEGSIVQLVDSCLLVEFSLSYYRIAYARHLIDFKASSKEELSTEMMIALQPLGERSLGHIIEKVSIKQLAIEYDIAYDNKKLTFHESSTTQNAIIFNKDNVLQLNNKFLTLTDEHGLDGFLRDSFS